MAQIRYIEIGLLMRKYMRHILNVNDISFKEEKHFFTSTFYFSADNKLYSAIVNQMYEVGKKLRESN